MKPINRLKHPIEKLIAELQALPPGTTYEVADATFHGGQMQTAKGVLGTGYSETINIVCGLEADNAI